MTLEQQRRRDREDQRKYRARMYADPYKYAEFRAKMREYERSYRARRRARFAANPQMLREYKAKHRAWKRKYSTKDRLMKAMDAEYYAVWRAERRKAYATKRVAAGFAYRPTLSKRVPDWATFGRSVVDTASPWLIENITPSQRAYARELAIERVNKRCR